MNFRIQIRRFALAACLGVMCTAEGRAQMPQLAAGLGTTRYMSEEPAPAGGVLNRERGDLERSTLELRHRSDGWTWQFAHRQSAGTLDYRGRTQLGLPLSTSTDLRRSEFALGGARSWPLPDSGVELALGAGVEATSTRRRIRATAFTGELIETLNARQWSLGASAAYAMQLGAQPLRVSITLQADRPWSQRLVVDSSGVLGNFELHPDSRWGSRLGLAAAWTVGAGLEVGIHIEQQIYRPGTASTGAAVYPSSVQKLQSFTATLAWTP